MSEKPILFSGEMVQAIIAGHKTQTRRVVTQATKFHPTDNGIDILWVLGDIKCPYDTDFLWVREKFQAQNQSGQWWHEVKREERPLHNWAWTNPIEPAYSATPPRWLPSIHMPRAACRIILKVNDVRLERLDTISRVDCQKEGVLCANCKGYHSRSCNCKNLFLQLWDRINRDRGFGFSENPWVWVVEFTLSNPHCRGRSFAAEKSSVLQSVNQQGSGVLQEPLRP